MKEVLLSVKPYWLFLIIAKKMGWNTEKEKTIEVRKTYPKDKDWNRVVKLYCSKDNKSYSKIPSEYWGIMSELMGRVVGEFLCDRIIDIDYGIEEGVCFDGEYQKGFETNGIGNNQTCLSFIDLENYLTDNEGYGWHISELVIYDKPKELSEFSSGSSRPMPNPNTENGYPLIWSGMTRPPQSWCYVEGWEE